MPPVGTLIDKPRNTKLIALGQRKEDMVKSSRPIAKATIPDDFIPENREAARPELANYNCIAHGRISQVRQEHRAAGHPSPEGYESRHDGLPAPS